MYELIKSSGERLGLIEAPTYVKKTGNGSCVLCPEPEASGIAFAGTVYHLAGREAVEDAETVSLVRGDAGAVLTDAQQIAEDAAAMTVDQEYRLTLMELGLLEDNERG